MPHFLISWDAGYGPVAETFEAKDQEDAVKAAYESWHEEVESNGEYGAEPLTSELCEEHRFDPEKYGLPPVKYDD